MAKTLANVETDRNVDDFIDNVSNKKRREDARTLLEIIKDIKGTEPKIWGVGIIGFGKYKYKRKNGEEYEWFNVGFSPAKAHTTVYLMYDVTTEQHLLDKLGEYKAGKGCLYIKSLEKIDMKILKKLISKSDRWR